MNNSFENMLAQLSVPPPDVSSDVLLKVLLEQYELEGTLDPLGGERDRNFHFTVQAESAEQYLVKVANPVDNVEILAMQNSGLVHLERYAPEVPFPKQVQTVEGDMWCRVVLNDNRTTALRVFHFLQGHSVDPGLLDITELRSIGSAVAHLDRGLLGFMHSGALQPVAWDIQRFDQLSDCLQYVENTEHQKLIKQVFADFESHVQPVLGNCRAQVIHNDVSFHNIVATTSYPVVVSGIFDFGDMVYAPLIQEVAVSAAEFSAGRNNPLESVAAVVAGYHAENPLHTSELNILPVLMRARLAMSCLIEAWANNEKQWVDNRSFLSGWYDKAINSLNEFQRLGDLEIEQYVKLACGIPVKQPRTSPSDFDISWRRRSECLGNANYISYTQPIQVDRGEGVWLIDRNGKKYLDAYNNVPHVGHCHPRVVAAIARQTATLNTNTRYLYDHLPDYAERLLATLPDELDTCYFVSSGSEANDLAWRIAKAWTGNTGAVVMDNAYHGVTEASFNLSPAEKRLVDDSFTHVVEMHPPDDFRGQWKRDDAGRGVKFASYCDDAISRLSDQGHRPAAFIMDMIMSSNGVLVPPPDYLSSVYEKVHVAGGLCIADEVQSGFGRLGSAMWGFELAGGLPDIVTFGKPIANGYPMGMLVTRREIARCFEKSSLFFSTTGGNPVACAAASAVLDVLEAQQLQINAERTGIILRDSIRKLGHRYSAIGDVRGSGLFIGVDMVEQTDGITPAPKTAKAIENQLKEAGILIGIDGKHENVLKIRPPMIITDKHCQFLLNSLEGVLEQVTG